MVQKEIETNNDEADGKAGKDASIKLPQDTLTGLEGMGFTEKDDKPGLFMKEVNEDVTVFWDFRKNDKGSFYGSRKDDDGNFQNISRNDLEVMDEYLVLRSRGKKKKQSDKKTDSKPLALVPDSDKKAEGILRGSERDLVRLMEVKVQLNSIVDASDDKKKLGEGLLWHELNFGKRVHVEPSAELVDMLTQDMGNITTEIVEFDQYTIVDPNTNKKYGTYYCVVKATDNMTGTSGLGAAEQVIDFDEISRNGRTFARTNAIRKAERNAKERLIPIPRKAMVHIIKKKLEEFYEKQKKTG